MGGAGRSPGEVNMIKRNRKNLKELIKIVTIESDSTHSSIAGMSL